MGIVVVATGFRLSCSDYWEGEVLLVASAVLVAKAIGPRVKAIVVLAWVLDGSLVVGIVGIFVAGIIGSIGILVVGIIGIFVAGIIGSITSEGHCGTCMGSRRDFRGRNHRSWHIGCQYHCGNVSTWRRVSLISALAVVGMRLNLVADLALVVLFDFPENLEMLEQSLDGRCGVNSDALFFPLLLMRRCHGLEDGVGEFFAAEDAFRCVRGTWEQRHVLHDHSEY
jgi:hypothetical protein